MDIRNLVQSLVRKYNTRNPFEILRQKNVILVYAPLNGVRGFYQYFQRNHIIYIDENLSDSEKRFVCAHELGHMLLHKKANALFMDTHTTEERLSLRTFCCCCSMISADTRLLGILKNMK